MGPFPFTADQFFEVFAAYNTAVWPFQLLLVAGAAAVAIFAWRSSGKAGRTTTAFLAILWIWAGLAYHLGQFTRINPAAYLFAGLFVLQGMLFGWASWRGDLRFAAPDGGSWKIGALAVVYALVIYPLLGWSLGQRWPAMPTFGAPCPSAIFTFGILLWTRERVPVRLLVIPSLWAVLTAPMAVGWGVWEDAPMPILALFTVVILSLRNRRLSGTIRRAPEAPLATVPRATGPASSSA
jgi:hypothetical protein